MKKVFLLCIPLLLLVGCRENTSDDGTKKLEKTVSSLKKENEGLNKRIETLQDIVETLDTSTTSSSSDEANKNSNTFPLNKPLEFKSGEKVTVQSIEEKPDLQLHETTEGEHPVVVTAVIENAGSSPLSVNAQNFSLYDNNSELARFDASTYSNNIPHEIAAGMKATFVMHFSSKGTSPFSVTFGDAIWKQ